MVYFMYYVIYMMHLTNNQYYGTSLCRCNVIIHKTVTNIDVIKYVHEFAFKVLHSLKKVLST